MGANSVNFGGGGAAGTLKPLHYSRAMFSCIVKPYPRLDTKNPYPVLDLLIMTVNP